MKGTISFCRHAGMPRAARRMCAWQNKKPQARAAAASAAIGLASSDGDQAVGISAPATIDSRVIQEVCG